MRTELQADSLRRRLARNAVATGYIVEITTRHRRWARRRSRGRRRPDPAAGAGADHPGHRGRTARRPSGRSGSSGLRPRRADRLRHLLRVCLGQVARSRAASSRSLITRCARSRSFSWCERAPRRRTSNAVWTSICAARKGRLGLLDHDPRSRARLRAARSSRSAGVELDQPEDGLALLNCCRIYSWGEECDLCQPGGGSLSRTLLVNHEQRRCLVDPEAPGSGRCPARGSDRVSRLGRRCRTRGQEAFSAAATAVFLRGEEDQEGRAGSGGRTELPGWRESRARRSTRRRRLVYPCPEGGRERSRIRSGALGAAQAEACPDRQHEQHSRRE